MLSQQEIKDIFAGPQAIITNDHFVYAKKPDGWYHGYDYVNKDAVYPYTSYVNALCREIAIHFCNRGVQTVVGPTVGAVSLSQWTTHWLNVLPHVLAPQSAEILAVCADEEDVLEQREILANTVPARVGVVSEFSAFGAVKIEYTSVDPDLKIIYLTKVATKRVIKRGYDKHVKGKKCLIVEDVINSGATVAKTRDAVLQADGEVVGVGALCNRSGGKVTAATLCVPELFSLLDVDMKMFKEDEQGFCPICREKGRGSVRLDLGKGKEFLARIGIQPGEK